MDISKKVKLALDESRMLVLGTQVLIGFQFRSGFQEAFDSLPPWSRYLDGLALLLMVCALGLLILPGPYHRIVEEGKNSGRLQSLIGVVASCALTPFAVGIGLAVGIACERVWGPAGGLLAGAGACLAAFGLWYGLGEYRKPAEGNAERAMSSQNSEKARRSWIARKNRRDADRSQSDLARGASTAGLSTRNRADWVFREARYQLESLHGAALLLVCFSILLLMAPAAYHRVVYAGEDSTQFHKVGSWLVTISTVPLALGLSLDILVVGTKVWASTGLAVLAALLSLLFLVLAWHVIPLTVRAIKKQGHQPALRSSSRLGALR
jgi:hypothetical protein